MRLLIAYAAALITMLCMDAVWLNMSFALIYQPVLGPLQAAKTNWPAAAAFYLLYPCGILFFASLRGGGWTAALLNGAMLGFFAYATYDLTNFATLRGWTLQLTMADVAWGVVITASASLASFLAVSWFDRAA
ncbi:MAG TPA: DUF2177 family protein [Rhizomicrobium sp.]|jgi:uncharacterized membrane protein|nr:DUF2177 family protein [Rhizomicrobium sp.]